MNEKITPRQKELLKIIYSFIKNTGYPPTFEEMKEKLKVSSNQSILDLLNQLHRKKIIKKSPQSARGLIILPFGYNILGKLPLAPLVGSASAGYPIPALEISGKWESVGREVDKLSEEIFLLKINGDSMINAGIDDGDVVLVKRDREFISGNIVYARVGNDVTIKRFISQDKPPYVFLKPENPKYNIIYCTDEVTLEGKVIFIFKEGNWIVVK